MGQISKIVLLAGAALSVATPALAQNADQNRAYAAELQADAAGRASLQGRTASEGLTIRDGSGNFSLRVGALLQFRYTADFRGDGTGDFNGDGVADATISSDDDTTLGFNRPATQLRFSGTAGAPELKYYVQGSFNESGVAGSSGNFSLDDAYAGWSWDNGFTLAAGQLKVPVIKEWAMDEGNMLAAGRSITGAYFGEGITGRTQGILGSYASDSFRLGVVFDDGHQSQNTPIFAPGGLLGGEADFGLTGRVDIKFAGDWSQAAQFSSWQNSDFGAFVGGGIHYEQWGSTGDGNDAAPAAGVASPNPSVLLYTIDGQLVGNGWGAYAAFTGMNVDLDTAAADDVDQYGILLQGSIFLADQWEIFGRWDWLMLDKNNNNFVVAPDELDPDDLHFLTFGVNYYVFPQSQTAKLTLDTVIGLNETYEAFRGSPGGGNSTLGVFGNGAAPSVIGQNAGVLGDIDSGEFAIRAQFQLMF